MKPKNENVVCNNNICFLEGGGGKRDQSTQSTIANGIGPVPVAVIENETEGSGGGGNVNGTISSESIGSSGHSFLFLGVIFIISLIALFLVYSTFPNLEP